MRLKCTFKLNCWIEHARYDNAIPLIRTIDSCQVGFLFNQNHRIEQLVIEIPNIQLTKTPDGKLDAERSPYVIEVYKIAHMVINTLFKQTGVPCEIVPTEPECEFIGDTPQEQQMIKEHVKIVRKSLTMPYSIRNNPDFSEAALSMYNNRKEALSIYTDALRMSDLARKFVHFYRVIENFISDTGQNFDYKVALFAQRFDPRYDEALIAKIRKVRNMCSHAKRGKPFITSENLSEVVKRLHDIHNIAQLFLDHSP